MNERKYSLHPELGYCAQCGKLKVVELHHVLPLSLGGKDDFNNLVALCEDCHKAAHKGNRSECIKAGMRKERECDILISYYDIAALFYDLIVDANGSIHVQDILDILDKVEIKRRDHKLAHIHERKDNYLEKTDKINEWFDAETV